MPSSLAAHPQVRKLWHTVGLADGGSGGLRDAHQEEADSDAIVWKPQNLVHVLKGIWFGFTGKLPGSLFSRQRVHVIS